MITAKEQYRRAWQHARMIRPILKNTHPERWLFDLYLIKDVDRKTQAVHPYTWIAAVHLKDRENE